MLASDPAPPNGWGRRNRSVTRQQDSDSKALCEPVFVFNDLADPNPSDTTALEPITREKRYPKYKWIDPVCPAPLIALASEQPPTAERCAELLGAGDNTRVEALCSAGLPQGLCQLQQRLPPAAASDEARAELVRDIQELQALIAGQRVGRNLTATLRNVTVRRLGRLLELNSVGERELSLLFQALNSLVLDAVTPPPTERTVDRGRAVSVELDGGVSVSFEKVRTGGSIRHDQWGFGPELPAGFEAPFPIAFHDISTRAVLAPRTRVRVSIPYDARLFEDESRVRLFHEENGVLVDRTVAINTENDTVQAEVTVSSVDRRRGRRCDKRQQGRPGQARRRECVLGFFVPLGPVASGSIDTPVPTLGESGLLTLNLLIGVMGIWLLRRSRSLRSQRSGGATG